MKETKHVIVGTAGHIDHGKSTLVEALTGTNPDRLEEEKRRGITIDLGFAFLDLGDVRLGFVDVPGHERFVRNMLAGVGGIDLVVLVIAADESIKPQTREHFDICRLLGIPRGIVALTKSDLVDSDVLGLVRLEIDEFVRATFLEGAPVVPVSATTGAGLDALKKELLRVAESVPAKDSTRHFRLPIDRAFSMKGFGTVVTGTLVSGALRTEGEAELYPLRKRARVRGLHSGNKSVAEAVAGQRTAVNLAGVEREEIQRGMVLAPPGVFEPTARLDARITLLASARPLKNRARVHFHQGTAEAIADVVFIGRNELAPGESALAQLRLDQPVLLLPGDRFILRQFSPVVTIGGGIALDVHAPRHKRADAAVAPFLETLERGNRRGNSGSVCRIGSARLSLPQIIARTGWTDGEIREVATTLVGAKRLRVVGEQPFTVASPKIVAAYGAALRNAIDEFPPRQSAAARNSEAGPARPRRQNAHRDFRRGARRSHSRESVARCRRPRSARRPRNRALARRSQGERTHRSGIRLAPASPFPVSQRYSKNCPSNRTRAKNPANPPARKSAHQGHRRACVSPHRRRSACANFSRNIAKSAAMKLPIPVFKELTGITRKYAIPLLEYLDRERVTRRVGDERVIL